MDPQDTDRVLLEYQKQYFSFLDDEEDQRKYVELIKSMIEEKGRRLIVNINDLRRKYPERAHGLLTNCTQELIAFHRAFKDYLFGLPDFDVKNNKEYLIGFEGSFGSRHTTPRTLHSKFLGSLVCVEGIVTKCSLVHPKVVGSLHFCPTTKKEIARKYHDLTSLEAFPSSSVYPTEDEDGNKIETEYGLCTYKDHQSISIQEMPEKAPTGQLPRSVDIICDDDLVDLCKPGDRIQVVGSYRCLPNKQGYFTTGNFRAIIIANNIQLLSKEHNQIGLTRDDVAKCKKLAKTSDNVFNLLAKSLAPSIHGHDYVKKAILCLLLGGVEKNLENGTRLRGDINVLLVGDPSVAKSQLLRYVIQTAPRAIATTGRGSSGVGLTAAVTSDQETGEKRLEAGAMVLADRGVVCIDEFDKMTDIDRTAIHEVMEQGKVTISKAGIHTSLNARCSVLAAANPVYGKYDQYKTPMENIGLQDSLLSRFDLLFVMLDTVDEDIDNTIADHVVRMHRYRNPKEQDGEVLPMSAVDFQSTYNLSLKNDEEKKIPMYDKYNPLLHGPNRDRNDKYLSVDFMRKYLSFAKIVKPVLTDEASEIISDEYTKLRCEENLQAHVARTAPVTARTLETMIRLSTAHARARMSPKVTEDDAYAAIELVQFAYFKKVLEKEKRKRRRVSNSDSGGDDDDEDEIVDNRSKRSRAASSTRETRQSAVEISEESSGHKNIDNTKATEESMETDAIISDERLLTFKKSLSDLFKMGGNKSLLLSTIRREINASNSTAPFTQTEVTLALERMSEDNQVMVADGLVHLV